MGTIEKAHGTGMDQAVMDKTLADDRGGPGSRARHAVIDTTLGNLTVVVRPGDDGADAVAAIYFPGHWTKPQLDGFGAEADPCEEIFVRVRTQFNEYCAGERTEFDLPLSLRGSEFERTVWQLLTEIEYGSTTSYGAIAEHLGNKGLSQRVGQAVGHNPVSVVVPCHRVVGSTGKLTGYAGGIDRKRWLLELEGTLGNQVGADDQDSLFGGGVPEVPPGGFAQR